VKPGTNEVNYYLDTSQTLIHHQRGVLNQETNNFKINNMRKISITRALSELKTLESRFEKKVENLKSIAVSAEGKLKSPNNMYKTADFEEQAKADLQSLDDLYNNICTIKAEIDKINATTTVEVKGKTMTIQEVLVQKKYINLKEDLLNNLKVQYNRASTALEEGQCKLEKYIEQLHASLMTGDSNSKAQDYEAIDAAARKSKEVTLVDPCNIQDKIKQLEDEIEEFKTNVDYTLSTVNSTTFIEIPD